MKALNNRIPIEPEESLVSYLFRLSKANYFESPIVIGELLDINSWEISLNIFDERTCKKISVLSRNIYEDIYSKSYHSIIKNLNENQRKMWFLQNKIKYCPKCLSEKRIHKFLWGFKPVSVCTKHFAVLSNTCQKCNKKIQISSLIKGTCGHCHSHLDRVKPIVLKADDILYTAQLNFQKLLMGDNIEVFGELSKIEVMAIFNAFFRLFDGFESLLQNREILKGHRILTHARNELEYAVSFANAYWMLTVNYPENFYYALDVFYKSDSPRKKYRRKQFTNFLSINEEFAFIKETFEKFKEIQIINGQVPRNLETFDSVTACKLKKIYFNKKEIFRSFDISTGEIDKMCEKNILKPKIVKIDNHTNYYFEKLETEKIIKKFLEEKKDLITKKEAAKILNIHVGAITHLIEKGLLQQKVGTVEKQYAFISRKSVVSLINDLVRKVIIIEKKDNYNLIIFEKCLDKYVTNGLHISKILHWAISGQIKFYSMTKEININNLYFDDAALKNQLKKEDIETNGYTLGDVSRILGFTERTLHKMINAKIILPVRTTLNKKGIRVYFFDKSKIEQFKETFLTVTEASEKYGVNYSTLNNLSHKKILKNYLKGVCRKTLFKRDELESELIIRGFIKK